MTFSKGFGLMHNRYQLKESIEKNRYGETIFAVFFDHPDGYQLKLTFNPVKKQLLLTNSHSQGAMATSGVMYASSVKSSTPAEKTAFLKKEIEKANPSSDKDLLDVVNKVTRMAWSLK